MSTTPTGGPSGPPKTPNPQIIDTAPVGNPESLPVKSSRKLIARVIGAIAAILIVLWIRSRIADISTTAGGWEDYQKAIAVILLIVLLIWLFPKMRRRWRERKAAPANSADQPKPKSSGWAIFGKFMLIFAALSLICCMLVPWAVKKWYRPGGPASSAFQSATMCLDDAGKYRRAPLDYRNVTSGEINSTPPKGCWIKVLMPPHAERWRSQHIGNNPNWEIYFMLLDGRIFKFGWADDNATFTFPQVFYMQGTQDGEEILFSNDDASVQSTPAKTAPRTVAPAVATPPPPPEAATPQVDSALTTPPSVISKVEGVYTAEAQRARIQGVVKLSFIVDENGEPRDIKVVRSLGFGLDEQAVLALGKWKFQPAMKGDQPVKFTASVDMKFRMI